MPMEDRMIDEYITGWYALNIHRKNGITDGDWHQVMWDRVSDYPNPLITMGGSTHIIDTQKLWKDYDIYSLHEEFKNDTVYLDFALLEVMKEKIEQHSVVDIYVAGHERAVLDLVYSSLKRHNEIINLDQIFDDHIGDRKAIQRIVERLNIMCGLFKYEKTIALVKHWMQTWA